MAKSTKKPKHHRVSDDPDPVLAARLLAWRVYRGMSQKEVARRIGYVQGWLSQVETGKTRVMPAVLDSLARVYRVPTWDLLARDPFDPTEEERAFQVMRQMDSDTLRRVARLDKDRLRKALRIAEALEDDNKH